MTKFKRRTTRANFGLEELMYETPRIYKLKQWRYRMQQTGSCWFCGPKWKPIFMMNWKKYRRTQYRGP